MHTRPITREDLPQVGAIAFETFKDGQLHAWLYPNKNKYPDDLRRYQMIRLRSRIVGPGQLSFVVATEEGDSDWKGKSEVVGYAYFIRCGDDECANGLALERKLLEWELWYEFKFLDRASDPVRVKKFVRLAPRNYFNSLGPRWHLSIIGVSSQRQRRGFGSMLVERGQKIAAEEGLPLTLENNAVGRKLYAKRGFKVVHGYEIHDGFTEMVMAREPEEMKGKWLEDVGEDEAKIKEVEEGIV